MLGDTEDLGQRLKRARIAHGLSQRKLAQKTGVANATISQIENNSLNPTVGVLKKIVSGFPLSLSEFFSDALEGGVDPIFFRADDLTELSDDGVSFRQVGRNLANKAIQLMHERYLPGATTGRHNLSHDGEECGLILSGELTVQVNGQSRVLAAGDAYYFKSDQPHSFRNDGSAVCELVTACSPPSF